MSEEYQPDRWVVLKIDLNGEMLYKVLAGWSGGYLDGDYWRMNSGITRVEEFSHWYEFHGHSGSVYKCGRKSYGLNRASGGYYNSLCERYSGLVHLMPEDTLWQEVKWQ